MAYTWPDGSKGHSISWDVHQGNLRKRAYDKSKGNTFGSSFAPASPGSPAAAANPAAVGPVVTPQPFDPAFEAQKLSATWSTQLADSESGYQKGETAWGTGYNADGSLNTSNPYSQAMLLQDSYKRGVTGTNNSMAAAGQLYSGARLNAQAHNDRVYAEGSSALKDQARQSYHGIDYGRLSTYGQNSLGVNDADYQSLRRAVYGG
jgi:hypothetical protein